MIPQINLYWIYNQFFWTILSFGLLIFLMYKFFIPIILSNFSLRNLHIKQLNEKVDKLIKIIQKQESEINDYQNKISNMLNENIFKINEESKKNYEKTLQSNKEANEIIMKDHVENLEKHKNHILSNIENNIQETIIKVVDKICH